MKNGSPTTPGWYWILTDFGFTFVIQVSEHYGKLTHAMGGSGYCSGNLDDMRIQKHQEIQFPNWEGSEA